MFHKFLLPLCLCACFAFAKNAQLYALKVSKNGNEIVASGGVLLLLDGYSASAKQANYDLNSKQIRLSGDVNLFSNGAHASRADEIFFDLSGGNLELKHSFALDQNSEIWLQATKLKANELNSKAPNYMGENITISSCDVTSPSWAIVAKKAKVQNNFVSLYDPVFKLGGVSVLWLPYFGFNTDTTRRSGLLLPEFAYLKDYGLFYRQPIYFAPADNYDIELDPQFRSLRGAGLYASLRYAGANGQRLGLTSGFFADKPGLNVARRVHSGFELSYLRDRIFTSKETNLQEGLWLNAALVSDIEYLNLKRRSGEYNSLVESGLNYFIASPSHYGAIYGRYYIDTTKVVTRLGNKETLQEFPSLQYHKFISSLGIKNLLYLADVSLKNYLRPVGPGASKLSLELPLEIHFPVLDEYASLSFKNSFRASAVSYFNKIGDSSEYDVQNDLSAHLNTDLMRPYDFGYHGVNLSLSYLYPVKNASESKPSIIGTNGKEYENFISTEVAQHSASLSLTQYLYSLSGDKILSHTAQASYYLNEEQSSPILSSTKIYLGGYGRLYNKFLYENGSFNKLQNGLGLYFSGFEVDISHNKRLEQKEIKDDFIRLFSKLKYDRFSLGFSYDYDVKNKNTKSYRISLAKRQRCYSYELSFGSNIEPTTTKDGIQAKRNTQLYFGVSFYPMGGVDYKYSFN